MLNSEFIGVTVAQNFYNTQELIEIFHSFVESLQFSEGLWDVSEFKRIKKQIKALKEEFEEDQEFQEEIFDEYCRILESIAPAYSTFCCNELDSSHGFWSYFPEFCGEFPENVLDKVFIADYKEITKEDFHEFKGYDLPQFEGKKIIYIDSLDALFMLSDGIYQKI